MLSVNAEVLGLKTISGGGDNQQQQYVPANHSTSQGSVSLLSQVTCNGLVGTPVVWLPTSRIICEVLINFIMSRIQAEVVCKRIIRVFCSVWQKTVNWWRGGKRELLVIIVSRIQEHLQSRNCLHIRDLFEKKKLNFDYVELLLLVSNEV